MPPTIRIDRAEPDHTGELLTLQRAAYVTEAQQYADPQLPPLVQSFDELLTEVTSPETTVLGAWDGPRLVGAVRLRSDGAIVHLGRLVVAPDRQGQGIGSALLAGSERACGPETREIRLFTGAASAASLRLYERHGYRRVSEEALGSYTLVHLVRTLPERRSG